MFGRNTGVILLRSKAKQFQAESLLLFKFLTMNKILQSITLNPKVCNGRPTLRNMRFTVAQMLELLASGMSHEEILEDYPYVEKEDIYASLLFAARMANAQSVIPLAA